MVYVRHFIEVTSLDALLRAFKAAIGLMIEGMRDQVLLPQYFIPIFEAAFPHGKVYRLENAGHFLYEDEPTAIALLIQQFIDLT